MGAKDKRDKERLEAIERRKGEVIEAAKVVFWEKSIEKATMQDIALKAEVGVASIYRYYTTKIELVMAVAKDYWERELCLNDVFLSGTGIEQTGQMINDLYLRLTQNPELLVFMDQLDAYMLSCKNEQYPTEVYEKLMSVNISRLKNVIEKGQKDGTIRLDIQSEAAGMTCVDLFISLAQRLVLREQVLSEKAMPSTYSALNVYKEMIIKYLETA